MLPFLLIGCSRVAIGKFTIIAQNIEQSHKTCVHFFFCRKMTENCGFNRNKLKSIGSGNFQLQFYEMDHCLCLEAI